MITAKNIYKKYGEVEILKGVDLHINKGEIAAIIGPSGAGKTTLLQILGTLDKSDGKYSLLINNTNIAELNDDAISKFRNNEIGFIFQFHQLLPEFTALENVCIPAFIAKKNKKETIKKAKELLNFLGLSHRENNKPNQLSGGEQQRVAVARALINNPSVIFADEPSGNLDSKSAENLHQLFFKLRDTFNQTFIIVTHNKELAKIADRTLVMEDGVITNEILTTTKTRKNTCLQTEKTKVFIPKKKNYKWLTITAILGIILLLLHIFLRQEELPRHNQSMYFKIVLGSGLISIFWVNYVYLKYKKKLKNLWLWMILSAIFQGIGLLAFSYYIFNKEQKT